MRAYSLTHLSDSVLDHDVPRMASNERTATAGLLAYLAEFDSRRRYAPAGYASMFAYCIGELRLRDAAAYRRIHAARTARRFPEIFPAVADGRLNLSAVVLLAPHLTHANAADLLAGAAGKTRVEIEEMLARRFPRTELMTMVEAIPASSVETAVRVSGVNVSDSQALAPNQHSPGSVAARLSDGAAVCPNGLVAGQAISPAQRPRLAPIAPGRFALQVTITRETHELMRHAQELASHQVPTGDLAELINRAFTAYVAQLEKRKFAATDRPRPRRRGSSTSPRQIPAHVKREVWKRDGGRCTFVGENGHRCGARRFLEFDHVEPVARGGRATVADVRLRCRMHNQYEAERTFGSEFMRAKRDAARRATILRRQAADRMRGAAAERSRLAAVGQHAPEAVDSKRSADLTTCLRNLGFRAAEARSAVETCEIAPGVTLEEHLRAALKFLCPRPLQRGRIGTSLKMPA